MNPDPFNPKKNNEVVLSGDAFFKRDGELQFDEQAYIDEALDILTELHGSYNGQDQLLVRQMASYERSFRMADYRLLFDAMHLKKSGAHGLVCSGWVDLRERCSQKILQIRKDLGLDLSSRNPITTGKQANESLFNTKLKEEKELVRR